VCDLETSRIGAPYIYIYDISNLRVKHVEFYSRNKFEKLLHLVGFIIRIRPCRLIDGYQC
jgi:hypothetical protein